MTKRKIPPLHAIKLYLEKTKGVHLRAPDLWVIYHKGQKDPKRHLHYARQCATYLGMDLDSKYLVKEVK